MKDKHLELIQGVINRMGQNSFLIKGWTITIVAALFALAAKDSNQKVVIIAYFPTIVFWLLDSYYLYQERVFRKVYDRDRNAETVDYSLNTKEFDTEFLGWSKALFSKTILPFYGVVIATLIIMFKNF
ncbi:MAG: hypothetical protein AB7P01_05145 [Bacteroidia bacterium]